MNDRGNYGRYEIRPQRRLPPRVGVVAFHGPSDRDTAAAQIDTQLYGLVQAVLTAAGADSSLVLKDPAETSRVARDPHHAANVLASRDAINKSPYRSLWDDAVAPTWNEWAAFYHDRKHWYDTLKEQFTSWEDYTSWADRANALRDKVEAAGIHVMVPRLHQFTESIQEKAEKGIGDVYQIVKYGLIGALGIGGIYVLARVKKGFNT
jgi:hypothetical protein